MSFKSIYLYMEMISIWFPDKIICELSQGPSGLYYLFILQEKSDYIKYCRGIYTHLEMKY